jgi:hypothetical protein
MNELKRKQNLCHVELRPAFRKPPRLPQVEKQLPTLHKVHDHIQLVCSLKRKAKLHNEWMISRTFQNISLVLCMLSLIPFSQPFLLQDLHSVSFASILLCNKHDFSKRSFAQYFLRLETIDSYGF